MRFRNFICLTGIALHLLATPLAAQDAADFQLELNNAADTSDGNCRLTYVASNNSEEALNSVSYEVAVFDGEGTVTRILVLEFGALPVGKTKVLQFDLAEQACSDTSRIVVNDVADCTLASGGDGDFCISGLSTASRTSIQFGT